MLQKLLRDSANFFYSLALSPKITIGNSTAKYCWQFWMISILPTIYEGWYTNLIYVFWRYRKWSFYKSRLSEVRARTGQTDATERITNRGW